MLFFNCGYNSGVDDERRTSLNDCLYVVDGEGA